MCHGSQKWVDILLTVFLGRTHVKPNTKASPAELIYGTTLRVSGEFFLQENFSPNNKFLSMIFTSTYVKLKPVLVAHHYKKRAFVFKELFTYTEVFLRNDAVKIPLKRSYSGPFKILQGTSDRVYSIEINGKSHVSVERLKPAHLLAKETAGIAATNSVASLTASARAYKTYP